MERENQTTSIDINNKEHNNVEKKDSDSNIDIGKTIKVDESINIEISSKSLMDLLLKNEKDDEKFIIKLQHVGNAPIMKNNKLNIKSSANSKLLGIYTFIKDALKTHLKENDTIIIYCNRNFCPSPSTLLKDLFLNFNVNNELILNYAIQEAWG